MLLRRQLRGFFYAFEIEEGTQRRLQKARRGSDYRTVNKIMYSSEGGDYFCYFKGVNVDAPRTGLARNLPRTRRAKGG